MCIQFSLIIHVSCYCTFSSTLINPGGHSAGEKNAGGKQEMKKAGDKETLEGQMIERKRKRSNGMNISTRDAYQQGYIQRGGALGSPLA